MICFHKYSKWKSICMSPMSYKNYLLQAAKCERCGKIKFVMIGTANIGSQDYGAVTMAQLKDAGVI